MLLQLIWQDCFSLHFLIFLGVLYFFVPVQYFFFHGIEFSHQDLHFFVLFSSFF